jgi:hypothetical protein
MWVILVACAGLALIASPARLSSVTPNQQYSYLQPDGVPLDFLSAAPFGASVTAHLADPGNQNRLVSRHIDLVASASSWRLLRGGLVSPAASGRAECGLRRLHGGRSPPHLLLSI